LENLIPSPGSVELPPNVSEFKDNEQKGKGKKRRKISMRRLAQDSGVRVAETEWLVTGEVDSAFFTPSHLRIRM
jgi:hypothetical protein